MIDKTQLVSIRWCSINKKYYEDKGYHYTKMGDTFDVVLSDLSKGSNFKVKAVCDICGEPYVTSYNNYNHYHENNETDCCKKCKITKGKQTLRNQILDKQWDALQKKLELQSYILISNPNDYKNTKSYIRYMCPKHGEQEAMYCNLIKGHGCPICGHAIGNSMHKIPVEKVLERITQDGCKLLNPTDYYRANVRNLRIRCNCGNEFITSFINFKGGNNRCRICSAKMSKGELKIYNYLQIHNINFDYEYAFNDLKDKTFLYFDFYLYDYNMCIEFDGEQHYNNHYHTTMTHDKTEGNKQYDTLKKHDKMKNDYCIQNGIELLRIPYWRIEDCEKIIDNKIKELDERYSLVS